MLMQEWHWNRLRALPTREPDESGLSNIAAIQERKPFRLDETDQFCVDQGWLRVGEAKTKVTFRPATAKFRVVTPEGLQAIKDAEAAWEKARKEDSEWGKAEFWVVNTTQGQVLVRVPERCGEIAEHACRDKFGDCWPVLVQRQDDSHQWLGGGPNAYLDAMNPDGMPHWRTFTGRPLGDAEIEFKVTAGFPPNTRF